MHKVILASAAVLALGVSSAFAQNVTVRSENVVGTCVAGDTTHLTPLGNPAGAHLIAGAAELDGVPSTVVHMFSQVAVDGPIVALSGNGEVSTHPVFTFPGFSSTGFSFPAGGVVLPAGASGQFSIGCGPTGAKFIANVIYAYE